MTERSIRTDAVELAAEAFGDPADFPVLLIMGAMASMLWWHEEFLSTWRGMIALSSGTTTATPAFRPHRSPARRHTRWMTWPMTPSGCSTATNLRLRTSSGCRSAALSLRPGARYKASRAGLRPRAKLQQRNQPLQAERRRSVGAGWAKSGHRCWSSTAQQIRYFRSSTVERWPRRPAAQPW